MITAREVNRVVIKLRFYFHTTRCFAWEMLSIGQFNSNNRDQLTFTTINRSIRVIKATLHPGWNNH